MQQALEERVRALEETVMGLQELPNQLASMKEQIDARFGEIDARFDRVEAAILQGDTETRRHMRILFEDLVARIAALGERFSPGAG